MSKGPRPGQIDNSALLMEGSNSRLLQYVREGEHYELLCQPEWALFQQWYGGGPTILRRAIVESYHSRKAIVELHGVNIKVLLSNAREDKRDMNVSKAGTVRELKESCMAEFDIKVRLLHSIVVDFIPICLKKKTRNPPFPLFFFFLPLFFHSKVINRFLHMFF